MSPLRISIFLVVLALSGAPAATTTPVWQEGPVYQVFVRSFADSNGDGIGDLPGLAAKLDYLADMGIKAIWLLPIHPSPSYHKYDVSDYLGIHPDYGTMEDFEQLVAEANRRDIRIIIDLVINHTASDHPWFQSAVENPEGPHRDYYVWEKRGSITDLTVEKTGPDTDNRRRWHEAPGDDGHLYYAYFTGGMPDLNFDNPEVREQVQEIGKFWLKKGVAGFRLDAAKHIFPDDRAGDSVEFWREFRAGMEQVNPDVLLIGEVWSDGNEAAMFLPGLRSVFNFELASAILDTVRSGQGADLARRHADLRASYTAITPDFVDATFLSNHDQNRVRSELPSEQHARAAASILLTLPGTPYVYYGEEIGMLGRKPDPFIREPMLWRRQPDPDRTQTRRIRYSTDDTVTPVAEQQEDPSSLWTHYRDLLRLRSQTPALARGEMVPVAGLDGRLVAFRRPHDSGELLVLHNVSDETIGAEIPASLDAFKRTLWSSPGDLQVKEGAVSLPPFASVVLAAD